VADQVQFLGKGNGSSDDGEEDFEDVDEEPEPAPRPFATRGARKGRSNRTG
jgi:hypothetical protein